MMVMEALRDCGMGHLFEDVLHIPEPLARAVCAGVLTLLRSIPLDLCTKRLRGGLSRWPTYAEVEPLLPDHVHEAVPDPVPDAAATTEVSRLINFVHASSKLKMLKDSGATLTTIVKRVWPEAAATEGELAKRIPSMLQIRDLRQHFDCTMMLTMITVWTWIMANDDDSWSMFWADGSPTSGYEAFCCYEAHVSTILAWSRMSPITFLGFGYQHLKAKLLSFLWKLWLESKSTVLMRFRLARIRGFSTDHGTECEMADSPDCLGEFLLHIGWSETVSREEFLMPNAIWMCGWHHQRDHCAQWVSCVWKGKRTSDSNCHMFLETNKYPFLKFENQTK